MDDQPTVFVIEDDPSFRTAIDKVLTTAGWHVETFASPQEFLLADRTNQPGCAIIDICLPGMTGLQLQGILSDNGCSRPHFFLTGHGDVSMAVQAMKGGALGFLQKPFHVHQLLKLVQQAVDIDLRERAMKQRRQEIEVQLESLTRREREVLDLIVAGEQDQSIATKLDISRRTVELHRSRLMQEIGAESIAELVQMSISDRAAQNPRF